jgi:Ca2+-binding RTX toxin-like protein
MGRISASALALTCAAILTHQGVASPAAHAGTASVATTATGQTLRYFGAPGEANAVEALSDAYGRVHIRDTVAITPGSGCARVAWNQVACSGSINSISASLNDLRDTFSSGLGHPVRLWGGSGNDELRGEQSDDWIDGGPGSDRLFGEFGRDRLVGGDGDDEMRGGPGRHPLGELLDAGDVLSGGPGRDIAHYGEHSPGVYVFLNGIADDGYWGERDNVHVDVEKVAAPRGHGGAIWASAEDNVLWGGNVTDRLYGLAGADALHGYGGDDLLFGGSENDQLLGGVGADQLAGEAGADILYGHEGIDALYGHDGNDRLYAHDATKDSVVDCGPGFDYASADFADRVVNCEVVSRG